VLFFVHGIRIGEPEALRVERLRQREQDCHGGGGDAASEHKCWKLRVFEWFVAAARLAYRVALIHTE
jgi:hypothetical protein